MRMISPVSALSGYSVQAIYGNPVSVRPVKPVSEDTTANRAMMTVSRNNEIDVPSQISENNKADSVKSPTRSVATGGEAEIVKQLELLQNAIKESSISDENPQQDEFESIASSMSMSQNPFGNQLSSDYSNTLLEMGYQQNIRDKVSSSEAQSQVAEVTQKALDAQSQTADMTQRASESQPQVSDMAQEAVNPQGQPSEAASMSSEMQNQYSELLGTTY